MLKIKSQYDFWRTIKVTEPDGTVAEFKVQFSYDPTRDKQALNDILNALPVEQAKLATQFATQTVIGWDGIADADGKKLAFDKGTLEQILSVTWLGNAIVEAWISAVQGKPQLGN